MSQAMAVMYLGRFVETGRTETIFENPLHPYTQLLFASVLCMDPQMRKKGKPRRSGEGAWLRLYTARYRDRCAAKCLAGLRFPPPVSDPGTGMQA